ncbi:uncharacterized protein MONOS_613 [Monocercomonoides exilis]|uniref:uncharacterized protein n=1 Tax=Monocercomonoides exilis TaxID=2049356 RepID=UPI0035599968|nr:hypothetical protein MONOS_613 [Monocercomonoides exilis]|eukprot:MONOS_613.1-p1 / transcript=MONOS_613.1 / gene=MONOS_613 / organism=Monocercomonoides_exilis_PA203 / gene_product=unspecified product / transcript_product=unspecified product / location=Mono_scaffold00009:273959-281192(-) / protein_length=2245 / sequence_SO=supercontig / SO=protein_coding / is_pseudo=false
MENCLLYSCVNAFEGGISSGSYSSQEFVCENVTIHNGKRETNAFEKKGQINLTNSQTFSLCEWEDCTSPQGGALYIHDNANAILTVENCFFSRCISSTRGGGIYALKIAECIVQYTTFVQCSAQIVSDFGGGGIMAEFVYVQSMVDDCSFQNCSSGNDGGAINLRPTKTQRQKRCIVNSLFVSCQAIRDTGGAIEHWSCTDKVVVSNCLFCHCNSSQTKNRVVTAYNPIIDKSEWLNNVGGRVRFASSTETQSNAKDTSACGINESHPCNTISHCLTQLIYGFVEEIRVLSGTISETKSVDCGIKTCSIYGQSDLSTTIHTEFEASGFPLFSVSTGILTVRDLILVHDPIHSNNRVSRLFEITGTGEIQIIRLNISAGSEQSSEIAFSTELINVQNGMFLIKNVNWAKIISTTSLFSLSPINTVSLTLSECAFNEIERTTSGAALMSCYNSKANINLDSCSFSGCGSRTSADGGSMMLCVGNGNEVKVKGGNFDECYCSASYGLGGGILLRLMNENPNFLISSSFGSNTAKWGNDIFVISPNLEVTAKSRKIACVTVSLDSVDKVRGYDNGNSSVAIPLCIYLLPTPEEIYVSNTEALNHSHCGIIQFPCSTLKHSLTRQTGPKKIIVNRMIQMSDELAFAVQKHEIKGYDEKSGWTVSDASSTSNSALIKASVETELSKLIFSLPSSLPLHSTFISSSSSSMTLSQCTLSLQNPSSELTSLFLLVESGILIIDKFSAASVNLTRNPLISLSGSGTNTKLISTQWLNMTNSNFTEIERIVGSGGCINIYNIVDENSNAEINIEECVFDGCSVQADESRGGAIDAQLKGNIQMNIISCTFTGCTAPAGEEKLGFGGGMALKLIDGFSLFVISSPVFDSDKSNTAKYGNDLFVESFNLTKSITNTSLPFASDHLADISLNSLSGFDGSDTTNVIPLVNFWRAIGLEIFIGKNGKDMGACGFLDYPCLSIDYSLDRLPEGNEMNINIIGKGVLKKSVDINCISISSNNIDMCSLECLSSLEGAEEASMKISGIANFELIRFVIPSSFTSGVKYLMHVGSSHGLLTVKDCSFTKNEESGEGTINFGLIKADGATVQLEFLTIQSLSFSKDVISVLSTTTLNFKNLTMKNVELEGASGLSISKSSEREKNVEEHLVLIEWSLFEEVIQNTTENISIIRNKNHEPLKMVIRNTTMKRCGGLKCEKGGGMFCVLNEGGSFDCSFCTISECFCSTTGRGGWLFLEGISAAEQPLQFVLSNITLKDNSALRGRDVFVKCHSIEKQIVDEQFLLDFRAPFVKELAIWGCTTDSFVGEEDLLLRVVKFQSETIFVSSVSENSADGKQCGEFKMPCQSLNQGVQHIIPSSYSQLLVSEETIMNGECEAKDAIFHSLQSQSAALVHLNSTITNEGSVITTSENVRIERLKFNFGQLFSYSGSSIIHESSGQLSLSFVDFSSVGLSSNNQPVVLNSTLLRIKNGILHVDNCSITMLSFKKPSFLLNGDEINITNMKLEQIESTANVFEIGNCGNVAFNGESVDGVKLSEGCVISIGSSASGSVSVGSSSFKNCSRNSEGASVLSASSSSAQIALSNCSCTNCISLSGKGSVMEVRDATNVSMHMCEVEGILAKEGGSERNNDFGEICKWNGSLVHSTNSSLMMKDVIVSNASSGGLSVSAGSVRIEKGEFFNNDPVIEKYASVRRSIICSGSASLTISSLKGGDGVKDNSSLWILNDRCDLRGIAGERSSPFFIPKLEDVSVNENGSNVVVKFKGLLLLPCDLSFRLIFKTGDVELVETYPFEEDSFVSETEVIGMIPKETTEDAGDEVEVSVCVLFGKIDSPSSTGSFILKNRSETEGKGDDRIVEGGKEGKFSWALIWRRAEREAEKKNEERMKKRIYETNMEHSESSEHLLGESGSTEYILGRDSDKIPQWMLEKVDEKEEEEEETRKRTPSPSISSTSTTDTSDTESTFVRMEDACPTTSSMSNLVDAMACSSPHEKLIVDLRDSLFMLLHGRNEKKEMAIGSLKEREMTAAQILFWVANLALHSFDEMENPLSSLANLSPHIVLFSEHMVIAIALHSDCSSDSDTSSSISSSTVVTSASDDDDDESDSLPSSAFEDEEDNRYECLRWKAPELLMNRKMGATKESVAFSIGMMLWECLTLQIPFGEFEAEIARQKIANQERPSISVVNESMFYEIIRVCLSTHPDDRPSLTCLKRELIQRFPPGAAMLTMSDAIELEETIEGSNKITTVSTSTAK